MSNRVVISVEDVGKMYNIAHLPKRQPYVTLRDVIAEKFKGLLPGSRRATRESAQSTQDFWALRNVSFEVKQGDVVGIIGRNGAGKSTLLKILSRITEPSEGRVRIRGRVASLLEVGTGFHAELTGRENIFLNGAILGMSRAEVKRKFDEIVSFAEVEQFLDTPVKHYSSGMYVRLAFAVAAHLEPEILIVDEVLAVGDIDFQKKCLGKIGNVAKEEGRTVLFVSHNMDAVQTLCKNALLMERGRVTHAGSTREVTRRYLAASKSNQCSEQNPYHIGHSLLLTRFDLTPSAVEQGDPVFIEVEVSPVAPVTIKEMAVLFYSDRGTRVAILDLRKQGFGGLRLDRQPHNIQLRIDSLPLVEGAYRLGLYVDSQGTTRDHLDLASFTILARGRKTVPYASQHRGFIELDFSLKSETIGETVSLVTDSERHGFQHTNPVAGSAANG